jgi:hypothetical protein
VRWVAACRVSGKGVDCMGKGRWQHGSANRNHREPQGQQLEPENQHELSEPCAVRSRTHGSSRGKVPQGTYLSQLLRLVGAGCLQAAPTGATLRPTRLRPLETAPMGDQRLQSEQLQRFRLRHNRESYLAVLESHWAALLLQLHLCLDCLKSPNTE